MSNIEKTALSSLLDDLPVALNAALGAGIGGYGLSRYNKLLEQGSSEIASHVKNLDELTKLKSKVKAPIKTKDIHDYEDALAKFRSGITAREPAETANIRRYFDDLQKYRELHSKVLDAPTSFAATVARGNTPLTNATISTLLPGLAAGAIGGQEAMLASMLAPRIMGSAPLTTQMLSAAAAGQVGDVAMSHLSPGIQQAIGSTSGALKNLSDNLFSGYKENPQTIANSLATGKNKLLTYINPTRAFDEVSDIPRYLAAGMGLKYLNRRTSPTISSMAGSTASDKLMDIAQYIPGLELYSKLSPKIDNTVSKARSYLDKKRYVRKEMKEIEKLLATGTEKKSSVTTPFSKTASGFLKNVIQGTKNLARFSTKKLAPVGSLPAPAAFNPQAMSKLKAPAGAGGLGLADDAATNVGNFMSGKTDDDMINRLTTYGHNPYAYMVAGGVGAGALGAYSGEGTMDSTLKGIGYGALGALAGRGGAAASQAIKRMNLRGAASTNKSLTGRNDYIRNMYQKRIADNTDFAGREAHNAIKSLTGDAASTINSADRSIVSNRGAFTAKNQFLNDLNTNQLPAAQQQKALHAQGVSDAETLLVQAQAALASARTKTPRLKKAVTDAETKLNAQKALLASSEGELNRINTAIGTTRNEINTLDSAHNTLVSNRDSAQSLLNQYGKGSTNLATVRSGGVNFANNTGYIDASGNFVAGIGKNQNSASISQNIAYNLNAHNPAELQDTINKSFNATNTDALATLMSRAGAGDEAATKAMNMAGAHMAEMANIQRQQYSTIASSVSDTLNRSLPGMRLNPQQLSSHPNFSQYINMSKTDPDGAATLLNNIVADMGVGFKGGSNATIQSATAAATQSAATGLDNMQALLKGKSDELTKHLSDSSTLAINSSISSNISKSNAALESLRSSNPAKADEITARLNAAVSELSQSGDRAGANKLLDNVNKMLGDNKIDDAISLLSIQSGKANPYTQQAAKQTISNLASSSRDDFNKTLQSLSGRVDDESMNILSGMSKVSDRARSAAISGDVTALYSSSVDDLERISATMNPDLARTSMNKEFKKVVKNPASYFSGAPVPPDFSQRLNNLAQLSRSNPKEYQVLMQRLSQARDATSRGVFAAANDVIAAHTKTLANSIVKNPKLSDLRNGTSLKFDYSGSASLNPNAILGDAASMTQAPVQSSIAAPIAAPLSTTQTAATQFASPTNTDYYGLARKGLIGAGLAGAGYGTYSMLSAPTKSVYQSNKK